ncbi:DUF4265 domain-containing protein [Cellulomonas sp. NPDC089187]|uniref:DUF4265 domain-containing protein n=1 Tax=Cellulomonas sp. NPDC089187 TaxID=3154970 RepID=UPI0034306A5E
MEHVTIRFALEPDEDGWPPVASEGIWAQPLGDGRYRLDNTPWFVRGTSANDVVAAAPDAAGTLWCSSTIGQSDRLTVRVIPRDDGPLRGECQGVLDAFTPLGVTGEGLTQPLHLVALDIGPAVDLGAVKRLLDAGENDGRWFYEEGNVSPQWEAL